MGSEGISAELHQGRTPVALTETRRASLWQDPPLLSLFRERNVHQSTDVRFETNLPIVSFESNGEVTLTIVAAGRSFKETMSSRLVDQLALRP